MCATSCYFDILSQDMASVNRTKRHEGHYDHHAWLSLSIVGLLIVLVFTVMRIISVWDMRIQLHDTIVLQQSTSQTASQLVEQYRIDLHRILQTYEQNENQEQLLQELLTVHVPSEYLAMHVNLVIASDAEQFSQQELQEKIGALRTEYNWLK